MKEAIIQYNDTPSGGHLAISWEPLVRCKDCKHWEQSYGHCLFNSSFTNEDWFCADGVAKDINVTNKEGR